LAVVCSTATVAIVYATIWRLTYLRSAAAAGGLVLACTPLFWRWSLQLETFPLNNLLVALVVYLLIRWHQEPVNRKFLFGAAFAFGLALFNQETVFLLLPAIGWMLWLHRRVFRRQWTTIGLLVLAVIAGVTPYLYVPLAALGHSPTNWDYVHSVSAFFRLLSREDYGGLISQGGGAPTGSNAAVRTLYLARGFGIVMGTLALFGLFHAYRKCRWYFWFVILAVAFSGVGYMFATNLDPTTEIGIFVLQRFFLLPLVVVAPLTGLGVALLGQIASSLHPSFTVLRATTGVAIVGAAASLAVVGVNYSVINVSNDHVTSNYASDVLQGLLPHTILFATGDEADSPVLYMNAVEKVRPDVTVLLAPLLSWPWYAQVLRHNHEINVPADVTTLNIIRSNPNRPVVFVGRAPDKTLNGKYYFYPVGLTNHLEKVGTSILVTQEATDNEAQLHRMHVPSYAALQPDSFEQVILNHYADIPFRIGNAYAADDQTAKALIWYRKALAIDPSMHQAAKAIMKLSGAS